MIKGLVNRILPFSSVDGPGNRTAIFLQGCNFNCLYCHNPETINKCINCGECIKVCPTKALFMNKNKVIWNEEKCINCDACLKICNKLSSPKAKYMTVEEVMEKVKKFSPFISGITVSGGECTLQSDFLVELFKDVKKLGLTTFVDTNASIPLWERKELIENMDMTMIDMKSFNTEEHKRLTGMENNIVFQNINYLSSINKLYEIRTVIVPKVLDNYYNVNNISKLIALLNPNIRYKIIKYRAIGVRKDLIDSYTPSNELMNNLRDIAINNGCKEIVLV